MPRIRFWWPEIAGAAVILISRLLTMPRTFWEFDELLFAAAVKKFDPWSMHPHPPGYPLYVGLAKLFAFVFGDPFRGMVALSVLSCVIGYVFLARAFANYLDDTILGAAGALLFYFSAGALVHLTLPLSDSAAVMFLAMTLYFATKLPPGVAPPASTAFLFGFAASASIGVRPQLVVPLLPVFLLVILRNRRAILPALASFTALSLAWFLPLMSAAGGWSRLIAWELGQAKYVAAHDATMSRGGAAFRSLIAWFVIHPFGPKVIAVPLLLLAAAGAVVVARRGAFVPLLFGGIHLLFALTVMEPADAVRYSLPHVMIFCLCIAAALGVIRVPRLPWIAVALIAGASIAYTWPLIGARTHGPSPPFAAATYANRTFAPNTVIAYDLNLRPHSEYLMSRFKTMPIDRAMNELYDRPEIPVVLFVNGGSNRAKAKVFAWPAGDAYRILTRNLYEQVSLDPLQASERYLPLSGVYALERTAEGKEWRWLNQEAHIRLPRAHTHPLTLSFALPHDAPWPENVVHIIVNGQEVASVHAVKDRETATTIPLPPDGNVELTIRSERAFRPAETLGNRDPRVLAVELVRVE
ncbi:MAG: hypothetical protein ACXVJT_07750 [Thermoanaerobaculia bacterium]